MILGSYLVLVEVFCILPVQVLSTCRARGKLGPRNSAEPCWAVDLLIEPSD